MLRKAVFVLLSSLLFVGTLPNTAYAQLFGKNRVLWENAEWYYYENILDDGTPGHFAFYIGLDLDEADVVRELQTTAYHLERAYAVMSTGLDHQISRRILVIITRTHSTFEGLALSGNGQMPEGVGAFATMRGSRIVNNMDLVLVIKPDFLPTLNHTIAVHELGHIFQFDMVGWQFFMEGLWRIPHWLFEASAEYLAGLDAPYTRDDIRRRRQRIAAANSKDTSKFPTLLSLNYGLADPYAFGAMVFEFLDTRFGRERTLEFVRTLFRDHKETRLLSALEDISEGAFSTPEAFDRAHRDYWASLYVKDALDRAKPYEDTPAFSGRQIIHRPWPYRLTTPKATPDGTAVVFGTVKPKYGLVLGTVPALPRDNPPYIANPDHRARERERRKARQPVTVLTKYIPPQHYEYPILQELDVWPFNGFDLDVWQEPTWALQSRDAFLKVKEAQQRIAEAKGLRPRKSEKKNDKTAYETKTHAHKEALRAAERQLRDASATYRKLQTVPGVSLVAFFARHNADHALFIQDTHTRKIVAVIEFPKDSAVVLDQAFSPSFSPDGLTIYFSAAHNIRRDIYAVRTDGASPPARVTTEGRFNTAPAVSPDGAKLAYVSFAGRYQKLFLRDLTTGATRQLTDGQWNDNSPSWSSDSSTLVFTSDAKDRIWNLNTLTLADNTVRQWTDFFGGAYTPTFMPGENDRVVFTALVEDDQNENRTDPNLELFDIRLKEPLSVSTPPPEPIQIAESPQPAGPPLDAGAIKDAEVPSRWKFYDGDLVLYGNSRGGFAGYADINLQNILGDKTHGLLVAGSRYLKLAKYQYLDESHRLSWSADASFTEYPLVFRLSGLWGQFPSYPEPNGSSYQYFLNWTRFRETEIGGSVRYPFSKFNRIEVGARARRRDYTFTIPVDQEVVTDGTWAVDTDRQYLQYFGLVDNSVHASVNAAYVHDSILYSARALGPVNGSALRAQVEFGHPLNSAADSFSAYSVNLRQYIRMTERTVFAVRGDFIYTTRPNGDLMYLGGNDTLRNYPYYSVSCDRCALTSAELRFPLGDAYILPAFPLQLRGIVFGDWATVRFSNATGQSPQQEWAAGFGVQVWFGPLPLNFEWARTRYNPNRWDFNVRVGMSF
jgi:hypothetical protein